jgi:hypothetical protein
MLGSASLSAKKSSGHPNEIEIFEHAGPGLKGNHPRMAQNSPILICHVPKIHIFLFGGDWNHGIL